MEYKQLKILESDFTIHRLEPGVSIPAKVYESKFFWIGKTDEELSIVCDSEIAFDSQQKNSNWKIIKIAAKLDFSLVGIMAEILAVLKEAEISIIALSTFDTDYIMIKQSDLEKAKKALSKKRYFFI